MRCWHHNIIKIIKNPEFKEGLLECLDTLEPERDNTLILDMLKNYFNSRNKSFGSNWVPLPSSRAILHLDKKGIYFTGEYIRKAHLLPQITSLNSKLKESIGVRSWTVTFREPYNKKD
jgi:hypothetical protein